MVVGRLARADDEARVEEPVAVEERVVVAGVAAAVGDVERAVVVGVAGAVDGVATAARGAGDVVVAKVKVEAECRG